MAPSIWQILIIVLIVAVFFGKGRVSGVMEDLGKGINAFKKGMKDEDGKTGRTLEDKKADAGKE